MFQRSRFISSVPAILLLSSQVALADTVFATGGPIGVYNYATYRLIADDFVLTSATMVTGATVQVAGSYGLSRWDGTAEYFVLADNGGSPGSTLAHGFGQGITRTPSGFFVDGGLPIFLGGFGESQALAFNFENSLMLAPNTPYWMGVHLQRDYNDGIDTYLNAVLFYSSTTGNAYFSNYGNLNAWQPSNGPGTVAFSIQGTAVPIPAGAGLLASALLTLVGMRKRECRQASRLDQSQA